MAFINKTPSNLYFGRFKVKSGDAVPAVDYTEVELSDIERFVSKGILANEDVKVEEVTTAPVVEESVAEEAVAEEATEEPKEDQAEGKKTGKKK